MPNKEENHVAEPTRDSKPVTETVVVSKEDSAEVEPAVTSDEPVPENVDDTVPLLNKAVPDELTDIADVMELYPQADRQRLRQLARQAAKEKKAGKPAKAFREIFQVLKELNDEEI